MDAELRHWVVQVRVGTDGSYDWATGFPIPGPYVLTALHVLTGSKVPSKPRSEAELNKVRAELEQAQIAIRIPHQGQEARRKYYPMEVVWDGLANGIDAALLAPRDPSDAPRFGRIATFAYRAPSVDSRWQSEAWPAGAIVAGDGNLPEARSAPLLGTVEGYALGRH